MGSIKFNGYTFKREYVESIKTFDEFYNHYKNSAYIQNVAKASDAELAAQKVQLQKAWAFINGNPATIEPVKAQEPQTETQSQAEEAGEGKASRKRP